MKNYVIKRTYRATDFNAVKDVYYQTWKISYRGLVPQDYLNDLDRNNSWHPESAIGNSLIAVSTNNQIVGVCCYGPSRNQNFPDCAEIYSIYVLPQWQHIGVGKNLLSKSLRKLQRNYQHIYASILENNFGAQEFYRSFGFQKTDHLVKKQTQYGTLTKKIFVI